jgi:colanic acid biosynthesis glycosyl transferase WcaI
MYNGRRVLTPQPLTPLASPKPRVEWVDAFKGIAIILVVGGHVIGGLRDSGIIQNAAAATAVYRWIYTFHMPAFFFASGLFAARSVRKGIGPFVGNKVGTLIYPYVIWTAVQWCCHESLSRFTNSKPDPRQLLKMAYEPYMNLWFLYALFMVFLIYAGITTAAGRRRWPVLVAGLILYGVATEQWLSFWPLLNRTAGHFVYFAIGAAAADSVLAAAVKLPAIAGFVITAAAAALLAAAVRFNLDAYDWLHVVLAMIGITGVYTLSAALDRLRLGAFLILCGLFSLEIYLMHGIVSVPTRIALSRLLHVRSTPVHLVIGLGVGIGVPIAAGLIVKACRIPFIFSWRSASLPKPTGHRRVLVISQTFVPDPASVGQHMADVAFELARRGHAVRVYASGRGYEDSSVKYPRRETLHGADVRRFPLASFGKKSLPLRVLGTAVFHLQAFFAVLFCPRLGGIFFSTSPPLIGLPVCIAAIIRRVPVAYWAMDLNPDQLITLGKIKPKSLVARILEAANRFILRRSKLIIALDRFMAGRLTARGIPDSKMLVMPPWPHENHIETESEPAENPFRVKHGLVGKFVVMYSGNHSPSNPLTAVLDAAVKLAGDDQLRFLFVGGGSGKKQVEEYLRNHNLPNVMSLPYQPIDQLRYSLSAADVHVVSLGESMVGIIHPCKIYGAMAAARPILFLGPRPSHISDLLDEHSIGEHVAHGDADGAVAAIANFRGMSVDQMAVIGSKALDVMQRTLSQKILCGRLCDSVERALAI